MPSHANPKGRYENSLQRGFSWKSSWEANNAQLAKYFFSTGKKYFLSWIIIFFQLGISECPFGCVFVRFYPCFCLFREVRRNMVGFEKCLQKVVNDEHLMFVGTSACCVRSAFGPYITGGRCTQRSYYENVKIFEMRFLGCLLAFILSWGVFYLIENQ